MWLQVICIAIHDTNSLCLSNTPIMCIIGYFNVLCDHDWLTALLMMMVWQGERGINWDNIVEYLRLNVERKERAAVTVSFVPFGLNYFGWFGSLASCNSIIIKNGNWNIQKLKNWKVKKIKLCNMDLCYIRYIHVHSIMTYDNSRFPMYPWKEQLRQKQQVIILGVV